MANTKTGLAYYNVDTDRYQDIRIKRLKKVFKCMGIAVYDYILCEIYRVRGCFIEWDDSTAFDVAEYFNLKESQVNEIVNYCCAVGLFSKELFTSGNILSSSSIQKRYVEMSTRAKRQNIIIPEKCKILPEVCEIITEECPIIPEVFRKVKKSKVKESKVDPIEIVGEQARPPTKKNQTFTNFEIRKKTFMDECACFVNNYGKNMVRNFFDYWTEPNKSISKMRFELEKTWDTSRRMSTWENNENKFNKNGTNKVCYGSGIKRPTIDELDAAVEIGIAIAEASKNK